MSIPCIAVTGRTDGLCQCWRRRYSSAINNAAATNQLAMAANQVQTSGVSRCNLVFLGKVMPQNKVSHAHKTTCTDDCTT